MTVPVETSQGEVIGWAEINVPEGAMFDIALTPIVIINPGEDPKVKGWLASPRTLVDTRSREEMGI